MAARSHQHINFTSSGETPSLQQLRDRDVAPWESLKSATVQPSGRTVFNIPPLPYNASGQRVPVRTTCQFQTTEPPKHSLGHIDGQRQVSEARREETRSPNEFERALGSGAKGMCWEKQRLQMVSLDLGGRSTSRKPIWGNESSCPCGSRSRLLLRQRSELARRCS